MKWKFTNVSVKNVNNMKQTTINSLLTARILFEESKNLSISDDPHVSSSGLILIQDALEIIFLAILMEKDVEQRRSLDKISFDELIGELRKENIFVPKSSQIKALNKQRVIIKHYGQLAEPRTVRGYAEAAEEAIDSVLHAAFGKTLRDFYLSDILADGEAKNFLRQAEMLIRDGRILEALVEIRKAIFVEIEIEYVIYDWREIDSPSHGFGLLFSSNGQKALYWKKNKKWIDENVRSKIDYIQIDPDRLRIDSLEWGVPTQEIPNIMRLTPAVFRHDKSESWIVQYDINYHFSELSIETAKYCLDTTSSAILKKQQHEKSARFVPRINSQKLPEPQIGKEIYDRPSSTGNITGSILENYEYHYQSLLHDPSEGYYWARIWGMKKEATILSGDYISGYIILPLPAESVSIEEEKR